MHAMSLPEDVQQVVDSHAPHFSATAEGKIKCELNGHTFPARADALNSFINGKKYTKLAKHAEVEAQLSQYEPFIVRSKNLAGMLFCALTGELLNARLEEVKQHLKGKKFGRAKERFQQDKQELLEEPSVAGSTIQEEDGPEGSDGPGWLSEEVLREYEMGDAEEGSNDAAAGDEEEAGTASAAMEEETAHGTGKLGSSKAKGKGPGEKQQRHKATAAAGKSAAGNDKQKQPKQQAANGSSKQQQPKKAKAASAAHGTNSSGKSKAPRAKKARTG